MEESNAPTKLGVDVGRRGTLRVWDRLYATSPFCNSYHPFRCPLWVLAVRKKRASLGFFNLDKCPKNSLLL